MPMTHYRRMNPDQAATALEEFLAERPASWTRLRAELATHGTDPDTLLDGSPASLTVLWRWIVSRRTELIGDSLNTSSHVPREQWPSWARHTVTRAKFPLRTAIVLTDGLVSYLAIVIITGAPTARWALGSPQDPGHHLHHHPVLTGNGHQVFIPTLPLGGILRLQRGEKSLHPTELEQYATRVIADLRTMPDLVLLPTDAPVEVVAEAEGFDVGIHPVIAARGSAIVVLMVAELTRLDGIVAVRRRGPDALEVHAPTWHADDLERWLDTWMKAHGPFIH